MSNKIINLSNFLSFIRLWLAIPLFLFLAGKQNQLALVVIVLAIASDYMDGYFARKWQQITEVGKVIDPLADKVCVIAGFTALALYHGFPVWLLIIIITRDVLILTGSGLLIGKRHLIMPSNMPGKITVGIISALGLVYILEIQVLKTPLIVLTCLFLLYSVVSYSNVFLKNIKSNE